MKQGTIQIDCGDETCDGCVLIDRAKYPTQCKYFGEDLHNNRLDLALYKLGRLPQCLETFKDNLDNQTTK
jgi:hypothetical protein